jgi:hypothetical protein
MKNIPQTLMAYLNYNIIELKILSQYKNKFKLFKETLYLLV